MKTSHITLYRLNRVNKLEQTLFCATGFIGGAAFLLAACLTPNFAGHFFCALLGLASLAFGLLLLLRRRCLVDWTGHSVSDEFKLLKYRIHKRKTPFANLDHILVRRNRRASEKDIYGVYLQKRDGGLIPLRHFTVPEGRDCSEASEFAQHLSADFELKVIEKDGLGTHRYNPLSM